jgi:hypothetical protein
MLLTILPYRDRSYVRFCSERTNETLFEITMIDGSVIVWGAHYRPSEFRAALADDGATVSVAGTLRDRQGPVVTFAEHLNVEAGYRVEFGRLPGDYDPAWSRDRT